MFEKQIAVSRIAIGSGLDNNNNLLNVQMFARQGMKIFVVPGKLCSVEVVHNGKKTVRETPLGHFGWEYDVLIEE